MIYTFRTQNGKEKYAVDEIVNDKKTTGVVDSVVVLPHIRNYIMIEAREEEKLLDVMYGKRYLRGMVKGKVNVEEVVRHEGKVRQYKKGDKIKISDGPLKGEEAIVKDVNKENVVVLPQNAAIEIPVTLHVNQIELEQGEIRNRKTEMKGVAKIGGKERVMKCSECGKEIQYLYIPSHRSKCISLDRKKIMMCEIPDKVLIDDECDCGCSLKTQVRKIESGARIL